MSKHDQQMEAESLAEFASGGSEEAFRRVVEAWLPLVMGTALRRTGGRRAISEDITQLVFIDLARRANSVRGATLSGWLYKHTCFTAAKVLRSERRRARRERLVAEDAPVAAGTDTGNLDDLLLDLGEGDRETLLLRYVEGRSHDEVAEVLGITRAAAQKRSERALERLRRSYRSDLTGAGLAMAVAPPMSGVAELGNSISGSAVSAVGAAPAVPFLVTPLAGAMWGAAAAITLAVVPLAMTWRDLQGAQAAAAMPGAATSDGGGTPGARRPVVSTSVSRAGSIQSPEEAVVALLAIADRYGVGKASSQRATAIVQSLPLEWSHAVLMGLGRRTPAKVRGTYWFPAVSKSLAAQWRPRRVPDDLIAAWPLFTKDVRMKLFGGCVTADLPATLKMLEGFETENRLAGLGIYRRQYRKGLREAIMVHLLRESPREAAAFYNTVPVDTWNDLMSRGSFSKARRDPAIRRAIWDAFPTTSGVNRHQLGLLMIFGMSVEEQRMMVESIDDPHLRALMATGIADISNDEEWWMRQVPEHLRLEMTARLWGGSAENQVRAVELMIEMEQGGGPEFDVLRRKAVRIGKNRKGVDHAALVAMANRITDPAVRILALSEILPKLEKSNAWMREHLTAAEREVLDAVWIPGDFY
jgi:RNA polymerase sigma factor (sigma-70 family)